jgi:hypothetical protein
MRQMFSYTNLLYVSFKHILISLTSSTGTQKSMRVTTNTKAKMFWGDLETTRWSHKLPFIQNKEIRLKYNVHQVVDEV